MKTFILSILAGSIFASLAEAQNRYADYFHSGQLSNNRYAGQADPAKIKSDYHLADFPIGSPQFENAFNEYVAKRKPAMAKNRITITQTLAEGLFLAEFTRSDKSFVLSYPGQKLADGTALEIYLIRTGKLHDFVTVAGANRRLEIWDYSAKQPEYTRQMFAQSLQGGMTFIITRPHPGENCATCMGTGRIVPTAARDRGNDGKAECKKCRGAGKIKTSNEITVKW